MSGKIILLLLLVNTNDPWFSRIQSTSDRIIPLYVYAQRHWLSQLVISFSAILVRQRMVLERIIYTQMWNPSDLYNSEKRKQHIFSQNSQWLDSTGCRQRQIRYSADPIDTRSFIGNNSHSWEINNPICCVSICNECASWTMPSGCLQRNGGREKTLFAGLMDYICKR